VTCACCAPACWSPRLPSRPGYVLRLGGRHRGPVGRVSGRIWEGRRCTHVKLLGRRALFGVFHQALCDHVFQDRREGIALGQLRRRFQYNLLQQIENTLRATRLVIVTTSTTEGELANSQLHNGQTDTPDIRLDCVGGSLYPLRGHVCACSYECLGNGAIELAGNTKVTQLDLTARVDENVGRLQIAMHDAVGAIQIAEATKHGLCDLAEHVDADGTKLARDPVERSARC
jgi:hypothetical protein